MKFTNTLQRSMHDADERQRVYRLAASKSRAFVWKLMRMMLVIGISFIIIYPLIVKLSVSIMSRSDMNDVAVRWIAKILPSTTSPFPLTRCDTRRRS